MCEIFMEIVIIYTQKNKTLNKLRLLIISKTKYKILLLVSLLLIHKLYIIIPATVFNKIWQTTENVIIE